MKHHLASTLGLAVLAGISLVNSASASVVIDWVTIGNPGNLAQSAANRTHAFGGDGYGAVADTFRISRNETTLADYAAFLNAKATTDPYNLYNAGMANDGDIAGIIRSGSSGSYSYSVTGSGARPITYVNWFDAARFTNWLHNGQGSGDTETGAYTLVGGQISGTAPAKNVGATVWIPSENEWFKAAYYDPTKGGSGGYWLHANQSDSMTSNKMTVAGAANYHDGNYARNENGLPSYLSDAGAYGADSQNYYGINDMAGNVWEWNDLSGASGSSRGLRGGSWIFFDNGRELRSSFYYDLSPTFQNNYAGFRVASVPLVASVPEFTFDSSTGTITGYTGAGGAVVIPASIDGVPVTAIADAAFSPNYQGIQSITSVTIPNSVTSIGNYAFVNCMSMTSVTIPNSVTSIGNGAFQGCSGLTSVTIPNNVTSIGFFTFYSCRSLTSVTIPASVTSIGDVAFSECSGLTSLTIPNSVTSIGQGAFENCSGLTSVTIGSGVTSIGPVAFRGCSGLANIEVDPNNLTYTSVGGCLYDKNQTTLIQCPAGKSGSYTIPNSVTSIGNEAFANCSGLTSVTIGNGMTSIGYGAFAGCSGLTNIEVDPNNLTYASVVGILYNIDQTTLIQCPAGKSGSYTIPNSVTSIGGGAFNRCSGLTSVTIGSGVTSIDGYTFSNCSSLTSVTIPASVTSIGGGEFFGCSALTNIIFKGNAPTLEPSFFSSPFSGVAIGATVTYPSAATGWGATYGGLPTVIDYSDVWTWTTTNNQVTIDAYTGTGEVVVIPNSIDGVPVTAIGQSAFQSKTSLTSVTIPNSVTSIGDGAFYRCSSLSSVTIGSGVTSIGNSAFQDCTGLTGVTIPSSVTSIGNSAFQECRGLTNVTIGSGVTSIGSNAFRSCKGLTSIAIPDSVTSIGVSAFSGCTGLTSVTIGNGVNSIGDRAFFDYSAQTRVMIPVATALGTNAFPPTTTILRYLSDAQLASRDGEQNAAGRVLGQADVKNAPNAHDLYSLSQVQALNVGTPLLAKDSATGNFKLTIGVEKSTNLVNFSPMAIPVGAATINAQGKMEFEFTAPDNAAFFRIESR